MLVKNSLSQVLIRGTISLEYKNLFFGKVILKDYTYRTHSPRNTITEINK